MYFVNLFRNSLPNKNITILLCGLSGIGKTSFMTNFLDFENPNSYTIGVEKYDQIETIVDNINYKINFIEIGGEDRFLYLIPKMIEKCDLVLLFFKSNDLESIKYNNYIYSFVKDKRYTHISYDCETKLFKINNKAYHKTNIKNLIRSLNYS